MIGIFWSDSGHIRTLAGLASIGDVSSCSRKTVETMTKLLLRSLHLCSQLCQLPSVTLSLDPLLTVLMWWQPLICFRLSLATIFLSVEYCRIDIGIVNLIIVGRGGERGGGRSFCLCDICIIHFFFFCWPSWMAKNDPLNTLTFLSTIWITLKVLVLERMLKRSTRTVYIGEETVQWNQGRRNREIHGRVMLKSRSLFYWD